MITDWIKERLQAWHDKNCSRHHGGMPFNMTQMTEFPGPDSDATVFARMTKIEQEAIIYQKILDQLRDETEDVWVFDEFDPAYHALSTLHNKRWQMAREHIMNRMVFETRDHDNLSVRDVMRDPKTEVSVTIVRDLIDREEPPIDYYRELFADKVLELASDEEDVHFSTDWNIDFNEYQDGAGETAIYPENEGLAYTALGLNGESGEIAEKIKKYLRERNDDPEQAEEYLEQAKDELGDVLWYLAMMAKELDMDLQDVAENNLEKLSDRQERDVLTGQGDNR